MSIGVVEAFEEAGRAKDLVMSPGDEYNGWMKWVVKNKQGGAVTFPTRAGQEATEARPEDPRRPAGAARPRHPVASTSRRPRRRKYAEMDQPDDWWASTLPANFKPKA